LLGVIVVDKPQGITSHDVVSHLRKTLGTRRVGHAGTLDPLATGVLVVAVGHATRFLQYLPLEPKCYEAEVLFGVETNTQDAEGEVVASSKPPDELEAAITGAMPQFTGLITQIPPMFSAVKVQGRPLYSYAREGETVDRAPRQVTIHQFNLQWVQEHRARFTVECSGGTYIRTLIHDLGQALGCGAHLTALRRTSVGQFALDRAIEMEKVTAENLIPLAEAMEPTPLLSLSPLQVARIREGQSLKLPNLPEVEYVGLTDERGVVFSAARITEGRVRPECVIPFEALYGQI
jgi:tRNA pseudouridine55 synthase